jgi:hypothetical protein
MGCTNLHATEEFARAAESEAARTKRGLPDLKGERIAREAGHPIAEHVDEFVAGLRSKRNEPTRL